MHHSLSRSVARTLASVAPVALAAVLSACTGERGGATKTTGEPSVQAGDPAAVKSGDMPGMPGMGAMAGGMGPEMEAHMQRMMGGASGEQMVAMLPVHRQMVANMLSRTNGEMRQMNMAADASWTATVDSLRQDLVRMPDLRGAALKAMMPAHAGRVTRLAEMHQQMMRSMAGGPSK